METFSPWKSSFQLRRCEPWGYSLPLFLENREEGKTGLERCLIKIRKPVDSNSREIAYLNTLLKL